MEPRTLQRFCGVALALGAVLIAVYSIAFSVAFPIDRRLHDLGPIVSQPGWSALGLTAFVAVVLMMIGFGGAYARLAPTGGALGLVGFLAIELAYLFQAAKVTWEVCIYPMLAADAGAAHLLVDRALWRDPGMAAFRWVATLSILGGVVLFSLALVRSRAFPRKAGYLVFSGAVLYGVGPMILIPLAHLGIVVLALGCLVVARALLQPAPAPGAAARAAPAGVVP